MYSFLLRHLGPRSAYWLTGLWYVFLIGLVIFTFTGPAADFRYGRL